MLNVYAVFDEEVQCVEVQWQSGQFGGSVSGTYCAGNNFAFDVPPGTTSRPACVESNSMSATGDVIVSIIGDCEPITFEDPGSGGGGSGSGLEDPGNKGSGPIIGEP